MALRGSTITRLQQMQQIKQCGSLQMLVQAIGRCNSLPKNTITDHRPPTTEAGAELCFTFFEICEMCSIALHASHRRILPRLV